MADCSLSLIFFFFNDTATTEIYPLSLHDALPICFELVIQLLGGPSAQLFDPIGQPIPVRHGEGIEDTREPQDRKSTRLNSSHLVISYAVFCLKKKKKLRDHTSRAHFIQ